MSNGLLHALRVLDLGGAESDAVSRLFADLGADVLKIEPPGGSPARRARPAWRAPAFRSRCTTPTSAARCSTRTARATASGLIELAGAADIVVDGGNPAGAAAFGTSCAALADRFGHLVALSVTDFGTTGPYASWQATDPVLYAMSTALSRTGPTSGTPVLPPSGVASATAAVQAAWAALVAYYHRLRCGTGEYIDFSRFEAVVQALDPPFGSEGQAAVGLKRSSELWRGRPRNQQHLPDLSRARTDTSGSACCRRGNGGACGLARRARAVRRPQFDTIAARYAASRELNAAIADLFAAADDGRAGRRGTDAVAYRLRRCSRRGGVGLRTLSRGRRARRRRARRRAPAVRFPRARSWSTGEHAGFAHPAPTGRRGRSRLGDKTFRRLVGDADATGTAV